MIFNDNQIDVFCIPTISHNLCNIYKDKLRMIRTQSSTKQQILRMVRGNYTCAMGNGRKIQQPHGTRLLVTQKIPDSSGVLCSTYNRHLPNRFVFWTSQMAMDQRPAYIYIYILYIYIQLHVYIYIYVDRYIYMYKSFLLFMFMCSPRIQILLRNA